VMLPTREHPLWQEVFRMGTHCLIGELDHDPPRIRLSHPENAAWYPLYGDAALNPDFPAFMKGLLAKGIVGTLLVPMLISGKVTGMISVRLQQKREFQAEEIDLTRALAHQAMLAMQLMRLSRESQQAAVMAERNRMARDIHDTLAQGFTGVIMQLQAAKGATGLTDASTHIERAENLARSSLGEARRSVRALRPRSLYEATLSVALANLLNSMSHGSGLSAQFQIEGEQRTIPPDWEEDLLRIAQESLTNTIKHAQAQNFWATLNFEAQKIQLKLMDDGRGFDPHAEHEGFGLIGMKERVDRMGGEFVIQSQIGHGTEIVLTLKSPTISEPTDEQHAQEKKTDSSDL
jgi:signal transduction histidine kinase